MAQETVEQGFKNYIDNVCGVPSEYNRMYGHHFRSFKHGAEWQAAKDKELIGQLLSALKYAKPYVDGAYECAFPDSWENESISEQCTKVINSTEEYLKQP